MKLAISNQRSVIRLTNTLLVVFLLVVGCWLLATATIAQSPEPSPSPDDERIKQKVEERIEKVLSTAEEGQKRALVGTLKSIANSTLTIETHGGNFQAKVAIDAIILNEDREEIELDDLAIGNNLIAMGYFDNQNVLDAKRVVVTEEFQIPETESVFGLVTDISQEEKVLTIKHPKSATVYMVDVGTKTKITKSVEGEVKEIKFSDIKENDRLVVIGEPEENEEKIITASLIHVVTGASPETTEEEEEQPSPSPISEEE
ncbi:hypothetical protein KKI19_00860 [Patescibacteria group bacterium]|nr:hypothetical protein [Patescibacteria group bacterium]